ncbi:Ribonuclease H domain [Sesbania bispinosa]|nr:Ribonuclease H domain [Sesbania bispinosa]
MSRGSYVWNSILKARKDLLSGFTFKLGNGETSFWHDDNWLGSGRLCDHVPFVDIHDVDKKVKGVWSNEEWVWLLCHNSLPTRGIIAHRGIQISGICPRCGESEESILHCLRDCFKAKEIWDAFGYSQRSSFYLSTLASDWVRDNVKEDGISFLAILWKIWCARNQDTFDQKETSGGETIYVSMDFANTIRKVYGSASDSVLSVPQIIGWSAPSENQVAVNTNGSVMDGRAGFGGLLRTSTGNWIKGFCGYLGGKDILYAELLAILKGLQLCWSLQLRNIKAMSDSLLAIQLIKGHVPCTHHYATIIIVVKHMLSRDWSGKLVHVFREDNNTADILAKQGVIQSVPFVLLNDPPTDVLHSLQADALGVLFPRI